MAKHERTETDAPKHEVKVTDRTYIGRHRERTDVSHDSAGFSVGRGVSGNPYDRS
jgi:hypothetical protein